VDKFRESSGREDSRAVGLNVTRVVGRYAKGNRCSLQNPECNLVPNDGPLDQENREPFGVEQRVFDSAHEAGLSPIAPSV
jgi:hypothetical protein